LQVALGSAVLGGLLICVVMALLTRPLRQLTSAADAIREADVDGKLDATTLPHQDRKDEIGRLSRAFGAMVQRLREQVQRVRRMDATRRDWVASISHDLRTPLTSLMGHLETVLLRGERSTPAERQRFLEIALKNARHLDRLSASLFDFARLDSDEVRLEKSPAQVCELIDDIAARFAHGAEGKGIALATNCDHSLPLIPIDAALLERALANLVENALRYTPAGGTIKLSAQREGEQIVLAVADTGPGVPEADLPRVFERFFQGSSQREGRGHAGLGLAIVRRVAELHGGRADAANLASGGARFSVYLPAP
jgi:signal transduction histidine kinase